METTLDGCVPGIPRLIDTDVIQGTPGPSTLKNQLARRAKPGEENSQRKAKGYKAKEQRIRQEDRKPLLSPRNTKTNVEDTDVRRVPDTDRRTGEVWIVVPRPAPKNTDITTC